LAAIVRSLLVQTGGERDGDEWIKEEKKMNGVTFHIASLLEPLHTNQKAWIFGQKGDKRMALWPSYKECARNKDNGFSAWYNCGKGRESERWKIEAQKNSINYICYCLLSFQFSDLFVYVFTPRRCWHWEETTTFSRCWPW
jgi:hypothetical protein